MSKIISADVADDIMYDASEYVIRECVGHNRWSNTIRFVYYDQNDHKYYEFFYDEPATEYQEGQDGEIEEYRCFEVKKRVEEVFIYERVS
jgi:hypothetical protein